MATPIHIVDTATSRAVEVTEFGQLVTGASRFNSVSTQSLAVDDQAYTFFPPISGKRFILTGVLLTADKAVTADCLVEVYEATGPTVTTVSKSLISIEMLKNSSRDIMDLNLLISAGVWINAKTDDNNVFATILGYYTTLRHERIA